MRADDHDRPLNSDHDSDEPPRMQAASAARGFDRLIRASRARRLSPRRLVVGILIVGVVSWGSFEGSRIGLDRLAAWVAAQPEHQIRFDAIVLEPAPPPFIRRGAEGILAEVRKQGHYPDSVSVLGLDADQLRSDMARSPWVEAVGPVRRSHGQVTVEITYRQPIALMAWPSDKPNDDWCVLVDRQGVEMPAEEGFFDWEKKEPNYIPQGGRSLIQIRGFGPCPSDRIGQPWISKDSRIRPGVVRQAMDLANFLHNQRSASQPTGSKYLGLPRVELDRSKTRFFLLFDNRNWVFWGAGPGAEPANEPRAVEKWAILERYVANQGALKLGPDEYLALEHSGASVRPIPVRPSPAPVSIPKRR